MADFLRQHVRHLVGRSPHAFADLGMARQPIDQADIDVPVFIGLDPGLRFHVVLADHRSGFHRGVDLVAGAIEEAGVDEHDALRARFWMQALRLTVVRRSSSMMPTFMVFAASDSIFSTRPNSSHRQRDLVGAVHLRLDDIDRAVAAVAQLRIALQVVDREQAGDGGIEHAFRNFLAVGVEHGIGEHVMADIAHQHQAAAVQLELLAVRRLVDAVGIERALQRLAALLESRRTACRSSGRACCDRPEPCLRHRPRRRCLPCREWC